MIKRKTYVFVSLTVVFTFILFGCVRSNKSNTGNHAANLTLDDQFTLTGKKHFVQDYPPTDSSGNLNVVVEIPAGTNDKWEVDKTTGKLKWEIKKGKPRVVMYLGYPGNYGMVPRTLLSKDVGGDGDPLDVIIIGPAVPGGSVVKARPIGVLKLLDDGEQDDKIIAILLDSPLVAVSTIDDLWHEYKGITGILEIWFSNYKGPGRMLSKGFGSLAEAQLVINAAVEAYNNEHSISK